MESGKDWNDQDSISEPQWPDDNDSWDAGTWFADYGYEDEGIIDWKMES